MDPPPTNVAFKKPSWRLRGSFSGSPACFSPYSCSAGTGIDTTGMLEGNILAPVGACAVETRQLLQVLGLQSESDCFFFCLVPSIFSQCTGYLNERYIVATTMRLMTASFSHGSTYTRNLLLRLINHKIDSRCMTLGFQK